MSATLLPLPNIFLRVGLGNCVCSRKAFSKQVAPTMSTSRPQALARIPETHLEYLQLLQSVLHKLLYPLLPSLALVFPESIARSPFCVFAEVVGGELSALSEQRSVLKRAVSDVRGDSV